MQHSCKTEGAVGLFTLKTLGAALRKAFVILESDDQTAEAGPAFLWRAARTGGHAVGLEVPRAGSDAQYLAGAEIDQHVEFGVGVCDAGQDRRAMVGIVFHEGEIIVVGEHGEARGDDVAKVRLHRQHGAEAP